MNAEGKNGVTPIYLAVYLCHWETGGYLLDAGARASTRTKDRNKTTGSSIAHLACQSAKTTRARRWGARGRFVVSNLKYPNS